jgi:hypothetical protein
MSSNNILNQDKKIIKDVVIKKIQDLRLKARDEENFSEVKILKKKIKKFEDFLDLLESGLPIDSIPEFNFHTL